MKFNNETLSRAKKWVPSAGKKNRAKKSGQKIYTRTFKVKFLSLLSDLFTSYKLSAIIGQKGLFLMQLLTQ